MGDSRFEKGLGDGTTNCELGDCSRAGGIAEGRALARGEGKAGKSG